MLKPFEAYPDPQIKIVTQLSGYPVIGLYGYKLRYASEQLYANVYTKPNLDQPENWKDPQDRLWARSEMDPLPWKT